MTTKEMYQYLETWKKRALSAVPEDKNGIKNWLDNIHDESVKKLNAVKEEMRQTDKADVTAEQEKDWEARISESAITISLATILYYNLFSDDLADAMEVMSDEDEDDEITVKA